MIRVEDIEKKEFSRGMRGYREDEVDEFLNVLIVEFDALIKENATLKAENESFKQEIDVSRNTEEEVVTTLETARKLMSEISQSAEKRAELLMKNAQMDAEIIVREAKESSEKFLEESSSIRDRVTNLRERFKNLLEDELDRFDSLSKDIFDEAEDIIAGLPEVEGNVKKPAEDDKDMSKTMINIR